MMAMRNTEEVQAIYQKRADKGIGGKPYVLKYERNGQLLIFFGCRHSNDPDDEQWDDLRKRWKRFTDHFNLKKVVFYEMAGLDIGSLERLEVLQKFSESGLIVWLSVEAGIPAQSPEPDQVEEIKYLKDKGYKDADIMAYYFGRQMDQWATRDYKNQPDWKKYAEDVVFKYDSLDCWDQPFVLNQVLQWFKQTTGKEFDPADIDALYVVSDPGQTPISDESGQFRDQCVFRAIEEKWKAGNDIFVVYGSGHAITLEPAIEELINE